MASNSDPQPTQETVPESTLREVLQGKPPGTVYQVPDLANAALYRAAPVLSLYCEHDDCQREMNFEGRTGSTALPRDDVRFEFVTYSCRHCGTEKIFALAVRRLNGTGGRVVKLGELPGFGPPIPARVISLVGEERDLFLKGYRAEKQGLGVGAFAYYRRIVEAQKDRILDAVLKVAKRVAADADVIAAIEAAKRETQFTSAVDAIRVPEVLLVAGRNPLTLLHAALSDGLHAATDDECLAVARAIRLVLFELAERAQYALREVAEIDSAVSTLLRKPSRVSKGNTAATDAGADPSTR